MSEDPAHLHRELAVLQGRLAEVEHERDALNRLAAFAPKLAAQHDGSALVRDVTALATELAGASFGAWFATVDELGHRYALLANAGVSREQALRFSMPYRSTVFDGKTVIRIDDLTTEARPHRSTAQMTPRDRDLGLKSYLAVPVIDRTGIVIGALMLAHTRPGVFTERSEQIIVALAAHAGTAMDNAHLYGDAQRLLSELERTNTELDQFTYAASHDLRAPLRGIANLATWIEEDLGAEVPAKVADHLEMLKGRAARMDRLINSLLVLARVGHARQRPERVDVTELLHETIDLLSPEHPARVLIIGAMPTLIAERTAMQQVLLHLIGNALRHAGRPDVEVRVAAVDRADEIELAVSDNGVGIPREHHERVWQIFQTLAPRDVTDSTGTGLAIVRKQVDASGGRAWIDSPDVGPGVTVRFTWPKQKR